MKSDPTLRWRMFSYQAPFERNPTTDPVGGIRVVIGGATPNFIDSSGSAGGFNAKFPGGSHTLDDAGVSLGKDSLYVWDRLWSNIASCPGAKTMTFCVMSGEGFNSADSIANASLEGVGGMGEFGFDMLMAGLCHFDSLTLSQTGRRLIFGNMNAPKKLALTIDGGLTRRLRYKGYRPGIDPRDTLSFYETLDSLRLANIPATIGVNIDSAATYARDIIKLREYSQARFTPQVWTGATVDDSSNYVRSQRFHDIFGRWNNRAFYGDSTSHTVVGADSSIYWNLKRARSVTDSLFPGRLSGCVLAPEDDYSPKQMRQGQESSLGGSYGYADSLIFSMRQAGFTCLRVDGKYTDARPKGTNPRGWFTESRRTRDRIGGRHFTLLAHAGYELGSVNWAWSTNDSAAPFDSAAVGRIEEERAGCGMWDMGGIHEGDIFCNQGSQLSTAAYYAWKNVEFKIDDVHDPKVSREISSEGSFENCRVMRMACSEFSGRRPDPARIGWHQVKWLNDWFRACNILAGKTIMQFAYPEDVDP
jgi:hypothetical protein